MSLIVSVILALWVVMVIYFDINMLKSFNDYSQVTDMKDSLSWLLYRMSEKSLLVLWIAVMILGVILDLIPLWIANLCAVQLNTSLLIQQLLGYTMWIVVLSGIADAIMYPFGLADVYNHSDNTKLIKMSKVSIAFDVVEIALVVTTIIKVIIGG